MTQEDNSNGQSAENRKKILLGILFFLLLVILYFQFFTGESSRSTPTPPPATGTPTATSAPAPTPRPARGNTAPIVSQPLDLLAMTNKLTGNLGGEAGNGRNIFVYPTPTPPPPPPPVKPVPPPPPPPVSLFSVSPSGVIARTGDFNVTVFGDKIPADGQITIDGRVYPTQIVGPTEAKTRLPAESIKTGGNLNITIRSKSDPTQFSNQVSINVAEPPIPLYRYIGLIVTRERKLAVLKEMDGEENIVNMVENKEFGKGSKKKWKILSITPQRLVIEDLELRITHNVSFTGENGN